MPYLVLMFIALVVALILKVWGGASLAHIGTLYSVSLCSSSSCMGSEAVMRICFGLALFFATTTIASLMTLHTGKMFICQLLYFIGLEIAVFTITNPFFETWAAICRFLSAIFLFIQLIILIDFGYSWNENWLARDDKRYKGGILAASALMLIASIVFWGLFFKWFGSSDACGLERFFISFTIIISVGLTLLSISGYVETGGLLPASVIVFYDTYLLYSALKNDPTSTCNTFYANGDGTSVSQIILGFGLVAASITYSSWSISSSIASSAAREGLMKKSAEAVEAAENGADAEKGAVSASANYTDEELAILKKANIFFHVTMFLASCYAAMLLTNWGTQLESNGTTFTTIGTQTMWVNIGTQWAASALYVWTLVAPRCCPNREF